MTQKNENSSALLSLPVDERPIIITLKDDESINYVGRFIKEESLFMLSLNDNSSDFVYDTDVLEWWYVNEHPTIIKEILAR
jgi:hypothetical protein